MVERNSSVLNDQLQIPENAGRTRLPRLLIGGVIIAAAVALAVYLTRPKEVADLYLTQQAARRDIVQRIEAAGRVDVRRRVEIPAPAAGRLAAIHVRAGDTVETGQVLAVLDERAAQLAVRSAKASETVAASSARETEAAVTAAQQALAQTERLHGRGLASEVDLQNARTELTRAQAARDAARAQQRVAGEGVASAKLSESLGQIIAPGPGVVLRAPERVGAAVAPDAPPLFVLGDPLEQMRVDAKVSETDIALLQIGQTAEVTVSALNNRTFAAKVARLGIDAEVELGAVLYPVTLLVDSPDRVLLPGMSARVQMQVAEAKQVLAVHEAALRFVPEDAEPAPLRSRVFRRIGPNQLEPVAVKPGISDGLYTAVEPLAGATLSPGDALATGFVRPEQGSRGPRVTIGNKK